MSAADPYVVSGFSRTVAPKRVFITGARGQLAGAIVDAYAGSAEVLAYSREELDITSAEAEPAHGEDLLVGLLGGACS